MPDIFVPSPLAPLRLKKRTPLRVEHIRDTSHAMRESARHVIDLLLSSRGRHIREEVIFKRFKTRKREKKVQKYKKHKQKKINKQKRQKETENRKKH